MYFPYVTAYFVGSSVRDEVVKDKIKIKKIQLKYLKNKELKKSRTYYVLPLTVKYDIQQRIHYIDYQLCT